MRLGITSFLTDKAMAPAQFAVAVEDRGFHSLYLPEHTHLPVRASTPPALVEGVNLEDYRRSLDPFVALATAASVTDRIKLGTGVVLAAQHDPIVLAKQIATLDHLSNGRVVLGIGFGWNRAEAEDHGVSFDVRREVARENMMCMQELWTQEEAAFRGAHVTLEPCWSWPKPVQQPRVTTYVGGGANPAVFQAIGEYGDGWLPIGGSGLTKSIPVLRRTVEAQGRDPDTIEVVPFGTIPTDEKLEKYQNLGINEVVLRVRSGTPRAMLTALDELSQFLGRFAAGPD